LFKKIFYILTVSLTLLLITGYFCAKPILLSIINKELQKTFRESSVSDFRLTKDFIEFQGVKIRKRNSYDVTVEKVRVYYKLRSILKKKIEKIEALNANLDFNKDDIKIKAIASIQVDISTKIIDYIKLNISSLNTNLFQAEGVTLNVAQGQDAGEFYIKAINYNKLKIGDVVGKAGLKENILNINPIYISFLDGNVKGEFNISLDEEMNYNLRLNSQNLEIKKFVDGMKLNEKFDMTGRLGGTFSMSGMGQEIKEIKGDFRTDTSGGTLIINDKTFLENVAKQSNQPLDIIVESFRNYNYNNGIVKLSAETGNLVMDLKLEGKSGKRSLAIILHDFNKGGETMKKIFIVLITLVAFLGCARVRVEAPKDPIKLDISMRLDIYQHVAKDIDAIEDIVSGNENKPAVGKQGTWLDVFVKDAYAQESLSPEVEKAAYGRRDRKPQLTSLEESGAVGENKLGMVEIRASANPSAQAIVDAEDNDRMTIYKAIAQKNGISIEEVHKMYAKKLQDGASSGTPVEVLNESSGRYEWKMK